MVDNHTTGKRIIESSNKLFRYGRFDSNKLCFKGCMNSKEDVKLNAFAHPAYKDMGLKLGDKAFFTFEGILDSSCFSLWQ